MSSHFHLLPFDRVLARATPLSDCGQVRRAAMRDELVAAVVRRRRTRRAWRSGLAVAALALVLCLLWPRTGAVEPARQHVDLARVHDDAARVSGWRVSPPLAAGVVRDRKAPLAHVDFAGVADNDSVIVAWHVPTHTIAPNTLVDDTQLLHLLAGAGRPTGLVRRGDEVHFTADVVDLQTDAAR